MDLTGYDKYLQGLLVDYALPEEDLRRAFLADKDLPKAALTKTGKW
jgi:hypothetical protein